MAKKRRGGGPNAPNFITMFHDTLKSKAYIALSGDAAKLMNLMARRFNGYNNPGVSMSTREAAAEVGCSPNHATKLFRELEAKGFIQRHSRGAFSLKNRHASTWRLLWLPERDGNGQIESAAKTYLQWTEGGDLASPKNQNTVARRETVSRTL